MSNFNDQVWESIKPYLSSYDKVKRVDKLEYAKKLTGMLGIDGPIRTDRFVTELNALYESAYADRVVMSN